MIPELKVPYLLESEVEHAANKLLCDYAAWKGKPVRAPIDIDDIVEHFLNLDIAYIDVADFVGVPDAIGATQMTTGRVLIDESLNVDEKEGRRAFTVAHECGHWVLHRPLIEAATVTAPMFSIDDMPAQPTIVCRSTQRKAPAEWQADRFAAFVLMPSADVRAAVRALYGDELPTWEDVEAKRRARELDDKLRELAADVITKGKFTNVSNEAMRYRLLDLKLVVDASHPQQSLL